MKNILFFIVASIACLSTMSQKKMLFNRLTTENGLTSNYVLCTIQDKEGFLWISTVNGLQRFDGKEFIKIDFNRTATPLPNTSIGQMVLTREGNILMVAGREVGIFDPRTFSYRNIALSSKKPIAIKSDFRLDADRKGNIFLCLPRQGLLVYDKITNSFTDQKLPVRVPLNWPVAHITEDEKTGNYWMASDSGIAVYQPPTNALYTTTNNPLSIPELKRQFIKVDRLFFDGLNRLWVFSWNEGYYVSCFDKQTNRFLPSPRIISDSTVGYYDFNSVHKTKTGQLWLGGQQVLFQYDAAQHAFRQYRDEHTDNYGVKYGRVHNIFEDREGALWISTDQGLYIHNPSVPEVADFSLKQSIDISFLSFLQPSERELWVSTWGQGILFLDSSLRFLNSSDKLQQKDTDGNYNLIWSLHRQSNTNQVWVGCQTGRVMVIDAVTKNIIKRLNPAATNNSTVSQITEDRNGNLWLGTRSGKLVKWSKEKPVANESFSIVQDVGTIIYSLFLDSKGLLWLSTHEKGVVIVDPATGKIVREDITKLFATDIVGHVQQLNDSIYFINNEGVSIFNSNSLKIHKLSIRDGLPSLFITSMAIDKAGLLWLGTMAGLCSYDYNSKTIRVLDTQDGIVDGEGFYTSYLAEDGKLFFGKDKRVIGFYPRQMQNKNVPPDVVITNFKLLNQFLSVDSLRHLEKLWFDHDQNSFSISFSSLSFLQQDKLVYYYKLDGAEKDWIKADKNNNINYSLLPPGEYTFLIRCENEEGVSSKNVTKLPINIRVPFWLSWWFILLCCCVFAGGVYLIYRESIKKKKAIEGLREKVARDLHDDMGSTLSTINILSMMAKSKLVEDPVRTSEYITKISNNSSRMMEAMDDIVWSINPSNDSMVKTISRMREFTNEILEARNINYQLMIGEEIAGVHLNMEQRRDFFLIYKEAINNAAKYSHCRQILVSLSCKDSILDLSIKDDGSGFSEQDADAGNGLNNMRKRAENLAGQLMINSQPGAGTIINLQFRIT